MQYTKPDLGCPLCLRYTPVGTHCVLPSRELVHLDVELSHRYLREAPPIFARLRQTELEIGSSSTFRYALAGEVFSLILRRRSDLVCFIYICFN